MLAAERAWWVGPRRRPSPAYVRAADLSSDEGERPRFTYLAGRMATSAGWHERALGHYETAAGAHAQAGRIVEAAGVTARLGYALDNLGRGQQAITRIREALASLAATTAPPEVVADLQSSLGRALAFSGHGDEAIGPVEQALTLAQHHELARAARVQPEYEGHASAMGRAWRGGRVRYSNWRSRFAAPWDH